MTRSHLAVVLSEESLSRRKGVVSGLSQLSKLGQVRHFPLSGGHSDLDQVEAKQLDMLQTLSNFNGTLKKTTEDSHDFIDLYSRSLW